MVVRFLSVLLILVLGQKASAGPVSGLFDPSTSVRDARSCDIYYSWVKNQQHGTWELEQKQCPAALYFEPTLNECKPADQLVIKCAHLPAASDRHSRRVRQLTTRDKKYPDLIEDEEFKYSSDETVPDKSMSPSNADDSQSAAKKLPFRRGNTASARPGTKRRKTSNGRPNKRRNKKNWVAIFVRGCNSRFGDSPFGDDDEQPDEQLEEDENQTDDNIESGRPDENQPNEPHNNELGDGSNENGAHPKPSGTNDLDEGRLKPSSNCTCNDRNPSTASKPGCDHDKDNLIAGSTASPSASTSSTTVAPNSASQSSTNKPTNSPIRENSPSAPKQSSPAQPASPSTSPTKPPATSARPPSTTPKPRPSKIVLIPLKITNPHNSKNATKVDEREALRRFLEELRKKRPTLSKESEKQLAILFKAKVRGDGEKNKEPVDHIEPAMVRTRNQKEPDLKDLKLDKLEEELGVSLTDAFNYYTNLADKTNSTGRRA